jgi:aminopeptidase N
LPDFQKRTITGSAELRFKPIGRAVSRLDLDAVGLNVSQVKLVGAELAEWHGAEEQLQLSFARPISAGAEVTVKIDYWVQPVHGLYFRTPAQGYLPGDTQLFTQGEAELHRHWFPCYDYPNERFTSEVICHVPAEMQVVSNGHKVAESKDASGLTVHHWLQDKPHVNYLVALAAGNFHKLEDELNGLPLALLVPPSEKDGAELAFRDTKKIISFFQKEIGVPFAWDKYYQVYCLDFLAGGMENTSCTFEDAGLLFRGDVEELDTLHRLDAHETAHQWFGDLVTCRDWSHLWLNEGFASYYTVLYEEQRSGRDAMLYSLWREAERVLPQSTDPRPIVWRDYADPMEQFDFRNYPKACWMLHMIRSRLGADLYRQSIQAYLQRHANTVATTDDLQDVLEEQSGLSFDQFFDQWAHHGGTPELGVSYSWDAEGKQVKLSFEQKQKVGGEARVFALDVPVRFFGKGEPQDVLVRLKERAQDFYFSLPAAPDWLRIDPDYTVLARIEFAPSMAMLKQQLKGDLIGRLLAVQELAKKSDGESTALLKTVLNEDAFYAVRSEAAAGLKKQGSDEARVALVGSVNQPSAHARRAVVEALAAFPHEEAQAALWALGQKEKNPRILAAILKSWGARPGVPEVSAALRAHLKGSSHHEDVAVAAIAALRAQNDASAVPELMEKLRKSEGSFEESGLAAGLRAVGFLARDVEDRSGPREFLAGYLNHARPGLRVAAAEALGALKDTAAIALLEPLTTVLKPWEDGLRPAAEQALQKLNAQEQSPAELKRVWEKMQALEKEVQQLKKAEVMKKAKTK